MEDWGITRLGLITRTFEAFVASEREFFQTLLLAVLHRLLSNTLRNTASIHMVQCGALTDRLLTFASQNVTGFTQNMVRKLAENEVCFGRPGLSVKTSRWVAVTVGIDTDRTGLFIWNDKSKLISFTPTTSFNSTSVQISEMEKRILFSNELLT